MKLFISILFTCTLFSISSFAVDGKILYKKCAGCHGADGKHAPFEKKNGILEDRRKSELVILIKLIGEGRYQFSRPNMIMTKVVKKLNDEDISTLAEYISSFKK